MSDDLAVIVDVDIAIGPLDEPADVVVDLAGKKQTRSRKLDLVGLGYDLVALIILVVVDSGHADLRHRRQWNRLACADRITAELEVAPVRRQFRKTDMAGDARLPRLTRVSRHRVSGLGDQTQAKK